MDMMREYVRRWRSPDTEKLRELLCKVTDEQKLNILLMMKDDMKRTPLHEAADRGHKELVKVIFISLSAEQREHLLRQKDCYGNTAIGVASGDVKTLLEAYHAMAMKDHDLCCEFFAIRCLVYDFIQNCPCFLKVNNVGQHNSSTEWAFICSLQWFSHYYTELCSS